MRGEERGGRRRLEGADDRLLLLLLRGGGYLDIVVNYVEERIDEKPKRQTHTRSEYGLRSIAAPGKRPIDG